jgi:hypothetical protein
VRSARASAAAPSDSATAAAVTVEPAPRATAAGPQILSVATSPGIVHGGEHAIWDVRTSPDVVSVTATVDAYTLTLVRRSAGRFGLDFAVPDNVPGVFHGTYNLQIVARSGTGATAARTVSVIFQ